MKVPEPPAEYLEFLKPFSAEITALALAARAMVLHAAPGCSELIYDAYNAVTSAYSYTGRLGDAFIHLPVYARWVNVGFNRGSLLKDPRDAGRQRPVDPAHSDRIRRSESARAPGAGEGRDETQSCRQSRGRRVRAIYPRKRRPAK
jgi:hypothetical protein